MSRASRAWTLAALLCPLVACQSLLPRRATYVESPWQTFDEAVAAFDRVKVGETHREELQGLGFDPYENENMAILTYMDVFAKFVPNDAIKLDQLDPGVQKCIAVRDRCQAVQAEIFREWDREYGNFFLNFFTFRTDAEITGWFFAPTIVLVDDTVAYKLWEGNPSVFKTQSETKPLGPFQDFDVDFKVKFP